MNFLRISPLPGGKSIEVIIGDKNGVSLETVHLLGYFSSAQREAIHKSHERHQAKLKALGLL